MIALLLMAVVMFVHVAKAVHTHPAGTTHACSKEKAGVIHDACSICEFQLAKDAVFTGTFKLAVTPVCITTIYNALFTSICPDCLLLAEGRGPPTV